MLALSAFLSAHAGARELSSALPLTVHHGSPAGTSVAPGVDWSRTRTAPLPAQLVVRWQRRLPGSISANLLVDARGNIFAAGTNRVWQLDAEGRDQYSRTLDSPAVASALLANGQRVVLTREGALLSWSALGARSFSVELPLAPGWARGGLLPLPDGNLLVSAGAWLLQLSPEGKLQSHAQLPDLVVETLVSAGRALILTERGDVHGWDGRSAPHWLGSIGGPAQAATLLGPDQLLVLSEGRALSEWSVANGRGRRLAVLEGAGSAARLSLADAERSYVLGSNGELFVVRTSSTEEEPVVTSVAIGTGTGELLSSRDGSVAWLVANLPLTLQRATGRQSLEGVSCAQPISLVPAEHGQLVAACRSGQVWFLGPWAAPAPIENGLR